MSGSCDLKKQITKLEREQRNLLIRAKNEMMISEMLSQQEPLSDADKNFLKTFLGDKASIIGQDEAGKDIYGKSPYKLALEIHNAMLSGDGDVARLAANELRKAVDASVTLTTKLQAVVLNKPDAKYQLVDLALSPSDITASINAIHGDAKLAKRATKAEASIAELDKQLQKEGISKSEKAFLEQKRRVLVAQKTGKDIEASLELNDWLKLDNRKGGAIIFPSIMAAHEAKSNIASGKFREDGTEYIGKTQDDRIAEENSGYFKKYVRSLDIDGNTIVSMHWDKKTGETVSSADKGDELSMLAVLLGYEKSKNLDADVIKIPTYLKNSIKINAVSHMEDIYKALGYEPGSEEFDKIWDLDKYSDSYDQDYMTIYEMHSAGMVPQSLILQSLGKAIYKSLPVKFSPEIDKDLQEKAITELGLYALQYMQNVGLSKEENSFVDENATKKAREKDKDAIDVTTNRFTYNDGKKNQIVIRVNIGEDKQAIGYEGMVTSKSLVPLISALQYLGISEDRNLPSSEKITDVSKTIRNSFMELPADVADKILKMQSKPLRFTSDMKNLWQLYALDKNAAYAMAGILSIDEKASVYDGEKELSKINYSKMQFDEMMTMYEHHWENDFYLPYDYTVSGRYMIDAILNPQESKITRFLVTSEDMQSTLHAEGSRFNEEEIAEFRQSVAQAFDLDPDKKMDNEAIVELDKIVTIANDGEVKFQGTVEKNPFYAAAVQLLNIDKILNGLLEPMSEEEKLSGIPRAAPSGFKDILMTANRAGAGMHAIQAIQALIALSKHNAEYKKTGTLTDHVSNITIESDAITSGMILTLLGIGTKDALALAAKGGVYTKDTVAHWEKALKIFNESAVANGLHPFVALNGENGFKLTHGWLLSFSKHVETLTDPAKEKTFNKKIADALAIQNHNMSFADFYNTVGKDANAGIIEIKAELEQDIRVLSAQIAEIELTPKTEGYVKYLQRELAKLGQAYHMAGFVGEITRKLAKSPVMVYIYGSMLSSIKQKLTSTIVVPKIYEVLNHPSFNVPGKETTFNGLKQILNSQELTDMIIKSEANKAEKRAVNGDKKAYVGLFTKEAAEMLKLTLGDMLNEDTIADEYDEFGNYIQEEYRESAVKAPRPEFKKFNGVQFVGISNSNQDEQLLRNLVISPKMIKNLKVASDMTLGAAFEEGFKKLGLVDDYRESVKVLEVVRFTMFKYSYDKAVNKVIAALKPENGKYHISSGDVNKIISELEKAGFGHSVDDINGGKQPLYKKEKLMSDIQAVLDLGNDRISSSAIEGKNYSPNTGASGVITVHNIDGFIDSTSSMMFNLVRIYDGSVSGINKLKETNDEYNKATAIATEWSSYNTQANLVAKGIDSMLASGDFDKMLASMSQLDKDNLLNTIEKLMGYKDIEYIDMADVARQKDSVLARIKENMEARFDENGELVEIDFMHAYVTDLAEPQRIKMTDGTKHAVGEGVVEKAYDAYGKIVKVLQADKRLKKYGKEEVAGTRAVVEATFMNKFQYDKARADGKDLSGVVTPDAIKEEAKAFKKSGVNPPVYLFADNLEHSGKRDSSGVSYAGTDNIIGIPIKKKAGKKATSHFTSKEDIELAKREIDKAFARIPQDRKVVFPADITFTGEDERDVYQEIKDHISQKIAELKMTNTRFAGHDYVAPKNKEEIKEPTGYEGILSPELLELAKTEEQRAIIAEAIKCKNKG